MVAAFVTDDGLFFEIPGVWLIDDNPHLSRCRSCQAPVVWARNPTTGSRAPFDPLPADAPRDGSSSSTNHFATCPEAHLWRRKSAVDMHVNRDEPIEERGR